MAATSQTWEWEFEHPPAAMWPLLADTARFNEAARLPKHQITEIPQPDGSVHYFGAARMGPFDIKWQEKPVNWVSEQWFEHTRYFQSGPVKAAERRAACRAARRGSRARYSMSIEPANLFGKLILGKMFSGTKATFSQDGGRGRRLRRRPARASLSRSPRPPSATKRGAASTRMVAEIDATPNGHGLARKLADHILERAGGRPLARAAACAGARVGLPAAPRDRGLPAGGARRPAAIALGPAVPALPGGQGLVGRARPPAAGRALLVLQHRLRARLLAQRRGQLPSGAGGARAGERRILHVGPDVGAACEGAGPAAAGRDARAEGDACRSVPIASAPWSPGRRPRSIGESGGLPELILDDGTRDGRRAGAAGHAAPRPTARSGR